MSHRKVNAPHKIKGNTKGLQRIFVIKLVLSINLVVMIFTQNPANQKITVLSNLIYPALYTGLQIYDT